VVVASSHHRRPPSSRHPRENLYSNSILALEAKTGRLIAYVQPVKNDFHDWDVVGRSLVDHDEERSAFIAAGAKDGYVYGIDRSGIKGDGRGRTGSQRPRGAFQGADDDPGECEHAAHLRSPDAVLPWIAGRDRVERPHVSPPARPGLCEFDRLVHIRQVDARREDERRAGDAVDRDGSPGGGVSDSSIRRTAGKAG